MSMKATRLFLTLSLLLFGFGGSALAQSRTGTIFGVVTDSTGAVLPGASVTATEEGTSASRESTSDSRGRFEFTLLPIGRYTIKVSLQGFGESGTKGIGLETQQNRELNVTLNPAGVHESLTVSATAQLVEVDRRSASLGQVINSTQVADLPLNGRNFVQLGTLAPGAVKGEGAFFNNKGTTEVSIRGTTSISVQGMRENANDFLLDGVDNNELTAGAVSILPSVESIQEFKVLTNSYSAEYGSRGGGTVLVSTKGGANAFHGSLFEFLRNDAFDARDSFAQQKGKFDQNQFGGSLGGPIVKGKTFFFVDTMGFLIRQAQPVLATVPTAKMRAGDFSESFPGSPARVIYDPATTHIDPVTGRITRDPFPNNQILANRLDPIALQLLNLYPLPTANDRLAGNFLANPVKQFNQGYFNSRIDHTFSPRDSIFGRVTIDHATQFYPYAFDYGRAGTYSTVNYLTNARNIAVSETHIFSSRLLNQVTGGYNYVYNFMTPIGEGQNLAKQFGIPGANLGDPENSTLPQINPALGFTALGDRVFTPFTGGTRVYHFSDTLTFVSGAHTVKAGGSLRMNRMETLGASAYAGAFSFDQFFTAQFGSTGALNAATGQPIASMLLGLPASGNRSQSFDGYSTTRLWEEYRGYVDDTWQVRGDLTLNLGLAYNLTTPQREANNRMSNFVFDTGQFIIASDSDPTAGVKTDKNNFEPRLGVAWSPGESKKLALHGGYGVFHDVSANGGVQGLVYNPPFVSELGFTSDNITPVRTLQTGFPVSARPDPATYPGNLYLNELAMQQGTIQMWNVNAQQEFLRGTLWTVAYAATRGRDIQSKGWNLNSAPPGPGFNTASRRPYPQYNTFNAILGRGTIDYNSVQFKAEKRFSQGSYLLVAYTYGKALTNGAGQNVGVGQGVRYYPYLPYPDADQGRSDTDIRHIFNASVIATLPVGAGQPFLTNATGMTEALLGNWQVNGIVRARSGLPLAMSMSSSQSGTALGNRPNQLCSGALPSDQQSAAKWFDTSCFIAPSPGVLGNAPRTVSISGPGLFNVDLSVFKNFSIGGTQRVQFRVEVFNLFNNTQLANPGTNVGAVDFGQILSTINPARQIQFALKLEF
jgi:Carboxypeptidase regulatory-like domain/TonB-dependent Receptor Plug Domain